jgi:type VI secretion system protein ImpK
MTDNPHDDAGDHDRTVIRPAPGGARRAGRPPAATPAPMKPGPADAISASSEPLAAAAEPLLHLLAHLRNTATAPDPGDIRERTWRELRGFERQARALGASPIHIRMAHYALCATLDDAILNMPWGARGRWHDEPLAKALHQDENAGRGFFEQLRTLRESLPESLPVVELMFVCLSLGMMGPYRDMPDGRAQAERVRHAVYELIEKTASPPETALAPDATGVDAHFEPERSGVPLWVGASAAVGLIAAQYVWFLTGLNGASDAVYQSALAAPPAAMPALVRPPATPPPPPPPPPATPGPAERLRAALADLPDVEVLTGGVATTLRIPARLLFPQTNAALAGPLPDRLAQALKAESGPIRVLGYTDSQPERSVAFPSNFALSTARAKAVRTVLAAKLADSDRIVAEGRAEADPVAPNASAEGREKNRRIDIVVAVRP